MTHEEIVKVAARRLADAAPAPSSETVDRVAVVLAAARKEAGAAREDVDTSAA